jgi:hypothetical protein
MKLGQILLRQSQHSGDDLNRERKGELADQVGATALGESIDALVDDRADDVALPLFHRPQCEGLLDQIAITAVLGLVHLQDAVAHHQTHGVGIPLGGKRVAIEQHTGNGVVAEGDELLAVG